MNPLIDYHLLTMSADEQIRVTVAALRTLSARCTVLADGLALSQMPAPAAVTTAFPWQASATSVGIGPPKLTKAAEQVEKRMRDDAGAVDKSASLFENHERNSVVSLAVEGVLA